MEIIEVLKQKREEMGISQQELARRMGIPQSSIARIENGEINISGNTFNKYLEALKLRVSLQQSNKVEKKVEMVNIFLVIAYLVQVAKEYYENDYDITNMKLNKLLYYLQMFYIGKFGSKLFTNNFEAWTHGPVCREVYNEFKEKRNQIINFESADFENFDLLSIEQRDLIRWIVKIFGKFSAFELRNRTHRELPWINARHKPSQEITIEDIKAEYEKSYQKIGLTDYLF